MTTIQIYHAVKDFAAWKRAFDQDPLHRNRNGVRRHRVLRSLENPHTVIVELDFDSQAEAEDFLRLLRGMWTSVAGVIGLEDLVVHLLENVESVTY